MSRHWGGYTPRMGGIPPPVSRHIGGWGYTPSVLRQTRLRPPLRVFFLSPHPSPGDVHTWQSGCGNPCWQGSVAEPLLQHVAFVGSVRVSLAPFGYNNRQCRTFLVSIFALILSTTMLQPPYAPELLPPHIIRCCLSRFIHRQARFWMVSRPLAPCRQGTKSV